MSNDMRVHAVDWMPHGYTVACSAAGSAALARVVEGLKDGSITKEQASAIFARLIADRDMVVHDEGKTRAEAREEE